MYNPYKSKRTDYSMEPVKFEYLTEHKKIKVILTDHARVQAMTRHGMPIETMKTWFIQAIDAVTDQFNQFTYNQEVFIYNRAFNRGMIVAFRRDCKSESKRINMAVVTVYPYGKSRPAHKDTKTIMI